MNPILHIFDNEVDNGFSTSIELKEETETEYAIRDYKFSLHENLINITASFCSHNSSYSIILEDNEKHVFSIMGYMKNLQEADPCLLYNSSGKGCLQITIAC